MVETSSIVGTMEAPSLYDIVKKAIYAQWHECLQLQKSINAVRTETPPDYPFTGEKEFKAGVMALWRSIEFKLDYHPDAECVKNLKELDNNGLFKGKMNSKIEHLEEAFRQITAFLEIDGITRFEKKRARSDLEIVEGLDEPGDF